MDKSKTLAEELKNKVSYKAIAAKYGTIPFYVGQIARGNRIPTRGKGLEIKKELERINQAIII